MRDTSRRTPNAEILRVKLAPTRPPGGSLPHTSATRRFPRIQRFLLRRTRRPISFPTRRKASSPHRVPHEFVGPREKSPRRAAALYAVRLILAGFASYLLWAFAPVMEKSIANAIKKHHRMERLIL